MCIRDRHRRNGRIPHWRIGVKEHWFGPTEMTDLQIELRKIKIRKLPHQIVLTQNYWNTDGRFWNTRMLSLTEVGENVQFQKSRKQRKWFLYSRRKEEWHVKLSVWCFKLWGICLLLSLIHIYLRHPQSVDSSRIDSGTARSVIIAV